MCKLCLNLCNKTVPTKRSTMHVQTPIYLHTKIKILWVTELFNWIGFQVDLGWLDLALALVWLDLNWQKGKNPN